MWLENITVWNQYTDPQGLNLHTKQRQKQNISQG